MDPDTVENYDETHMVIDMDNGQVLDFQWNKFVTYAEVSSGQDCFTVCFRVSGANVGKIEKLLLVFQNPNFNYITVGVPDDIPGVTYRTSPKGWVSQSLFAQYLSDTRIIETLSEGKVRKLWVDHCPVHNDTEDLEEALQGAITELRKF